MLKIVFIYLKPEKMDSGLNRIDAYKYHRMSDFWYMPEISRKHVSLNYPYLDPTLHVPMVEHILALTESSYTPIRL